MKKRLIELLLAAYSLVLVSSCIDLDSIISLVVFYPTRTEEYLLGEYKEGEFSEEVNPLFPDSSITGNYEMHSFTGKAGSIYAYYLHHAPTPGTTIFYCHGNTHSIDNYWPRAKLLYQTGSDVFLFDYRGFGMSEGKITETGMIADSRRALDYLINTLGVAKNQILLYGYSLGSVPAVDVAANSDMATALGLVLEAPVGSAELYLQDATYLSIPADMISEYRLDNISTIKTVTLPLLWMHGDIDDVNRMAAHGQAVYDASPATIKFSKIVPGAGHTDIPLIIGSDFSIYINAIANFIAGTYPPFS